MDAEQLRPATPVTGPIGGRPRALCCVRGANRLCLSFPWRGFGFVGSTVLGVGLMCVAACTAIWGESLVGLSIAVLAGPAGAVTTYVGIAGLLNRTTIQLSGGELVVRHGPVPVVRRVTVPVSRIGQLHVSARWLGPRAGPITRLWAVLHDGGRVPLTWYVLGDRCGLASYVERRVERELGIVDRPIVCPACGYDLRASRRRCPECGLRLRAMRRERAARGRSG